VAQDALLTHIAAAGSSPEAVALAGQCLLRLFLLLKRALLLATDPQFAAAAATALPPAGVEPGLAAGAQPGQDSGAPPAPVWGQQRLLPQPLPRRTDGGDGDGAGEPGSSWSLLEALGQGDWRVNVTAAAHVTMLQVLQAVQDPQRLFPLAPLAEELVPLLLRGRDGPLADGGELSRVRWAQLLQVRRP
jgi:hypothetical protein